MGRPKKYADAAERQAAYRANNARVDLIVTPELGATLEGIAGELNITKTALVVAMIKFALTNHDWKRGGVWLEKKKK